MAELVSSTCNECGAEVLVNRETDNYLFGRIYCEEHSVLRPLWKEAYRKVRRMHGFGGSWSPERIS